MAHNTRPRVLLADDYPDILAALARLLAPSCNVVGTVGDGGILLEAVARLRPDVVVVDVWLPTMNGLEACRHIRESTPHVAVVVMSAAGDAEIQKRALELGASAFVGKHRLDELEAVIEQAFVEGSRSNPAEASQS